MQSFLRIKIATKSTFICYEYFDGILFVHYELDNKLFSLYPFAFTRGIYLHRLVTSFSANEVS